MDRRRLVCARCAGLVSEGRCPTCRAARDEMHAAQRVMAAAVALTLAAIAAVLLGFGDLAHAGV